TLQHSKELPEGHAALVREAVIPVIRGDKIVAVLGVGNKPIAYTQVDIETIAQLADLAWEIIDHKRAEEARERRVTQLAMINDIGGKIAAVLELNILMERIVHLVQKSFNYHHVALFTISDDETTLILRAKAGNTESLYPEIPHLALGQGIVGWVAQHDQTRLVDNIKLDPNYFNLQQNTPISGSKLSVPIRAGKVVVGVLDIQSPHPNAFDKDDVLVIETLADQAAVALMNAQLYEKLITERSLLAQRVVERTTDLSRANAELARAARLKDEFLASMSHELRTPLNAILSISEMLQEEIQGPITERQARSLSRIEESGRHLLALINDILDLSKIGAGKMELQITPVTVEDLCQASLRMIKQLAYKKRLKVVSTLDNTVTRLQADERRLKQILVNLLNNAVKFTSEGGSIGLEVTGDAEQEVVHFTVWDTGIGISLDDMQQLFQPFVQLDSSLSRQYMGTGLGLSLVSRMVELHGGSVSVMSEVGKGSRFTISLPWSGPNTTTFKSDKKTPVTMAPPYQTSNLDDQKQLITQPHILLAEDNETSIAILVDYLPKKGYRLTLARNGQEALERISEEPPDLILMDIQMPKMDGLTVIRHIRANNNPDIAQIPIIAITALAMMGDRERCLEAGANEYLSKPISLKILVKVIEEQLQSTKFTGFL
ncbi:MAG: GAF domain-containing protein, partial [Anaerolineae bacterium]|nr:GAF domain-containing protein [Anaerolineae bacterium]